jgi:hypothetical protein
MLCYLPLSTCGFPPRRAASAQCARVSYPAKTFEPFRLKEKLGCGPLSKNLESLCTLTERQGTVEGFFILAAITH